jgi:hypothetical protein
VLLCLCAVLVLPACGKKGNPLPPLVRVPAPPGDFAVTRIEDQVYLRLTVPATNIDGAGPADVARVEVYAITLDAAPRSWTDIDPEDLRSASTLVATEPVRRPQPVLPPVKEGAPPIPLPPPGPGADQGAVVVLREGLTNDARVTAELPDPRTRSSRFDDEPVASGALIAPADGGGLQRYYFAVAVSPRGRYSPHSAVIPAPLGPTSGSPSEPVIAVEETSMTLRWNPPVDARGVAATTEPDVLPSRSIVPGPPATTYDVYEVPREPAADAAVTMPTPLTAEPLAATEFRQDDITLGEERCFVVRPVDIVNGVHVRGPQSPMACASFADTFAPSPPKELVAVSVSGGINLIWEPSAAADVAGYLVLRGEAGSATLTPLMTTPVTAPSYRDETVKAGVRYVYAVVAVDRAGNRSDESNRVEETAE